MYVLFTAILLKRLSIIIPTKQRLQLLESVVVVMNGGNITMTPILASSWGRFFHVSPPFAHANGSFSAENCLYLPFDL